MAYEQYAGTKGKSIGRMMWYLYSQYRIHEADRWTFSEHKIMCGKNMVAHIYEHEGNELPMFKFVGEYARYNKIQEDKMYEAWNNEQQYFAKNWEAAYRNLKQEFIEFVQLMKKNDEGFDFDLQFAINWKLKLLKDKK